MTNDTILLAGAILLFLTTILMAIRYAITSNRLEQENKKLSNENIALRNFRVPEMKMIDVRGDFERMIYGFVIDERMLRGMSEIRRATFIQETIQHQKTQFAKELAHGGFMYMRTHKRHPASAETEYELEIWVANPKRFYEKS